MCTPAHYPNLGGGARADLYVSNASGSTANVAVNILDKNGVNLAGVAIPGAVPPDNTTYPGETGLATVTLGAGATRNLTWQVPATAMPTYDGVTNTSFSIRITSDQPIAVGSNFEVFENKALPCMLTK
jgi:hypothetical protein